MCLGDSFICIAFLFKYGFREDIACARVTHTPPHRYESSVCQTHQAMPTWVTQIRLCKLLLSIAETVQVWLYARKRHSHGYDITNFQNNVSVASEPHTIGFCARAPATTARGALEGCSKTFFCRTMRTGRNSWCSPARALNCLRHSKQALSCS